eukprot:224611-Pleurochrysis_carterae.AAC.1
MARSPIQIMLFIILGNRYHVKYSCRSDASDLAAGDIPHIPPSATAYIALHRMRTCGALALRSPTSGILARAWPSTPAEHP